jgi:Protein of unknown function (DUF3500)
MTLIDYDHIGLRAMPPLSARHKPALPGLLLDLEEVGNQRVAERFVGITTDGTPVPGLFPITKTGVDTAPIVDAAQAFLASLDPSQRDTATLPVDSDQWRVWCNVHIYMWRHGVLLEDLSPAQREAALTLTSASLSARGFGDLRDLMRCNEFLAEITNSPDEYGEWAYFLTIFGTPSHDEPWGWQLDGHHINLHCFVLGEQMVFTPAFLGAEPCHVKSGELAGLRVFEAEERNGLAMVRSLSDDQAKKAILFSSILHGDVPPERDVPIDGQMQAGAFQDNRRLAYEGLRADEMSDGQRRLLTDLVETYIGRIGDGHAALKMRDIATHLDETHFTWMGGTDDVSPFYYKVQSPVVLIEFDHEPGVVFANEEPTRHHVHTIVRTPNGNDYGIDLLRQHYERHH